MVRNVSKNVGLALDVAEKKWITKLKMRFKQRQIYKKKKWERENKENGMEGGKANPISENQLAEQKLNEKAANIECYQHL